MLYARLDELQAGIKFLGRNSNNLRYVDDTHSNDRKQRGTKESLDEGEEESEKAGLKFNIRRLRSWHMVLSLHGKYKGKRWKQGHISSF